MKRRRLSHQALEAQRRELGYQIGRGSSLKSAAHDPKQDAQADVGRQLNVLHGQAPLSLRLGEIRLEIGANAPGKLGRSLRAPDDEPRPKGVGDRLFHELGKGKGYARDRIGRPSLAGASSSSKLSPSFSPTAAANSSMLWK